MFLLLLTNVLIVSLLEYKRLLNALNVNVNLNLFLFRGGFKQFDLVASVVVKQSRWSTKPFPK